MIPRPGTGPGQRLQPMPPPPGQPPIGGGGITQPPPPGQAGMAGGGGKGGQPEPGMEAGSMLPRFGYQGQVGVNPVEQMGLGQIAGMAGQQRPMETTLPAQQALTQIAGGQFGPQGQAFRQQVYDPTKAEAMRNLEEQQQAMAQRFAHRGGYFGGQHATAQARMAQEAMNPINQLMGSLNLQGFQGDVANRLAASQGLGGLAGTQRGIESSLLDDVMGGGQMLTQRELQNRELYQGASDRAYQDWQRARQERLMPLQGIMAMLGMPTQTPVVQMPQQSGSGLLGNLLGMGAGAFTGGFGGAAGQALGGK